MFAASMSVDQTFAQRKIRGNFLSRNAAWTEPFIEQITNFPAGRHDDMADMVSQASAWLLAADEITVSIVNAFTGRPFD